MLKTIVLYSGILGAVALAFPSLVTIGLFLGIIPGLILGFAPSVFLYSAATLAIRSVLPFGGMPATAASIALALVLGLLINMPGRLIETRRFATAVQPDVIPPARLPLHGTVAIEWQHDYEPGAFLDQCSGLCAALLTTPGVDAVIVRGGSLRAMRWSLVPRGSVPDAGLSPVEPGAILRDFEKSDPPAKGPMVDNWKAAEARIKAVSAEWALRLSTRETLVSAAAGNASADWVIARTVVRGDAKTPAAETIELRDATGTVRLRGSYVTHRIPSHLPFLGFGGSIENGRFEWTKDFVSNRPRGSEFSALGTLLAHAGVARPQGDADAEAGLRRLVEAALDNPGATSDQLKAANTWLESFPDRIPDDAVPLVARILGDLRVQSPLKAKYFNGWMPKVPPLVYREGLARRILDPATSSKDRSRCAAFLTTMPVGTFAQPSADEQRIWAGPTAQADAAVFLERLADRGAAALPDIAARLEQAAKIPDWPKRQPQVRALRLALNRLGKAASPALPQVMRLLSMQPSSPLTNDWNARREWLKTLLLLGLPPQNLPLSPTDTEERRAKERADLVAAANRYNPDERSGYNY